MSQLVWVGGRVGRAAGWGAWGDGLRFWWGSRGGEERREQRERVGDECKLLQVYCGLFVGPAVGVGRWRSALALVVSWLLWW